MKSWRPVARGPGRLQREVSPVPGSWLQSSLGGEGIQGCVPTGSQGSAGAKHSVEGAAPQGSSHLRPLTYSISGHSFMRKAWPTPCTVKGIRNSERFSNLLKAAQLSSRRIRMETLQFNMQNRCSRLSALNSELLRGRSRCYLVLRNGPSG